MKTIHAIFQDGVFRPTMPVDLPEGSEVTIEPKRIVGTEGPSPHPEHVPDPRARAEEAEIPPFADDTGQPRASDPSFDHLSPGMAKVYAIMSRRYDGGPTDGSARHDEHQP